ncbi:MAG: hypothetical protein ACI95T_001063, partial [Flavobacteriales bacterium]
LENSNKGSSNKKAKNEILRNLKAANVFFQRLDNSPKLLSFLYNKKEPNAPIAIQSKMHQKGELSISFKSCYFYLII